jgi:hypothetical protein
MFSPPGNHTSAEKLEAEGIKEVEEAKDAEKCSSPDN